MTFTSDSCRIDFTFSNSNWIQLLVFFFYTSETNLLKFSQILKFSDILEFFKIFFFNFIKQLFANFEVHQFCSPTTSNSEPATTTTGNNKTGKMNYFAFNWLRVDKKDSSNGIELMRKTDEVLKNSFQTSAGGCTLY